MFSLLRVGLLFYLLIIQSLAYGAQCTLDSLAVNYIDRHTIDTADRYVIRAYNSDKISIRDSVIAAIYYANNLEYDKTISILEEILPAQYLGDNRFKYGNFSYNVVDKEPMDNNWSAFIGAYLSYLLTEHAEGMYPIEDKLLDTISNLALHRVAQVGKRNAATNINILTAYFLLRAGELLNDKYIRNIGELKWASFYQQSILTGFREYNAFNYLHVQLYGLAFIERHESDNSIINESQHLQRILFNGLIHRYSYELHQLAGPYSRAPSPSLFTYTYYPLNGILHHVSSGTIPLRSCKNINSFPLHIVLLKAISYQMSPDELSLIINGINLGSEFKEIVNSNANVGSGYEEIKSYLGNQFVIGSKNYTVSPEKQSRTIIAHTKSSEVFISLLQEEPKQHFILHAVQDKATVLFSIYTEDESAFPQTSFVVNSNDLYIRKCNEKDVRFTMDNIPVRISSHEALLSCHKKNDNSYEIKFNVNSVTECYGVIEIGSSAKDLKYFFQTSFSNKNQYISYSSSNRKLVLKSNIPKFYQSIFLP